MARVSQDDIWIDKYLRISALKRKDPEDSYDVYYELRDRIRELANMVYVMRTEDCTRKSPRRFLMLAIVHKLMSIKDPNDIFKQADAMINRVNDILAPIYTSKMNNMTYEEYVKYRQDKMNCVKRKKRVRPRWNLF